MKISVLVPSERYLETAGVRIRYKRISAPLAKLGWTLDIRPIDDVPGLSGEDSRIYLFSKCQDARALVLAASARRAGIIVGVDLFDDYFSQENDARFATQRLWLQSMAQQASFFLCSTPRMLDVGNIYFAAGSGHVLVDPHEEFDVPRLKQELAKKISKARRERRIPILWFGMSDNPNFPVGLHDLTSFAELLRLFRDNSYKASLTIVTNKKGIDGRVLERLRRIPIPFDLIQWTKQREEQALSRCLVSFLPVNFQQFSAAKSLNRGISALVGGTQLLTVGYPLYETLRDFVYNDVASLITDLENSNLKLSSESMSKFSKWISHLAGPQREAAKLVKFLKTKVKFTTGESSSGQEMAVLHGAKSAASINSFAQRFHWLSLGSPLLPGGMKCDAHLGFFGSDPNLRFCVSQAGLEKLPEELRVAALPADETLGKGPLWEVPLASLQSEFPLESIRRLAARGACAGAGIDAEVMKITRSFFTAVFRNVCIVESELDPVRNVIRALERN